MKKRRQQEDSANITFRLPLDMAKSIEAAASKEELSLGLYLRKIALDQLGYSIRDRRYKCKTPAA